MIGNVAQIIALVSHGNAFLTTGETKTFYPDNSSFQYCESVDFRVTSKRRLFLGTSVSTIAANPDKWFAYLRDSGFQCLRFRYKHSVANAQQPDYMFAGMVGGGGVWMIEVDTVDSSVLWTSYWDVGDPNHAEQKIWRVTYSTTGEKISGFASGRSVSDSKRELRNVLNEITAFAEGTSWQNTFNAALAALSSENPELGYYHQDLLAGDVHLELRQLFYAAAKSWVFGGMGWWNDQYFEDAKKQRTFEQLTSDLFDAVNRGFEAGLNS